jgi:hypothetical protein
LCCNNISSKILIYDFIYLNRVVFVFTVAKVIKAQQTIEQIEEMKKDELLQGNNAALYQHLRNGGKYIILNYCYFIFKIILVIK